MSCKGEDVAVGEELATSCSEGAAGGEVDVFGGDTLGDTLGEVAVGDGMGFGSAVAVAGPFDFSAMATAEGKIDQDSLRTQPGVRREVK
jgi:hypothetical protein